MVFAALWFYGWPVLGFAAVVAGTWTAFEWLISHNRRRVTIGAAVTLIQALLAFASFSSYLWPMRSIGQGM